MALNNPLNSTVAVTIANGAAVSSAIRLNAGHIAGILMPSGWTAAGIAFQVANTEAEPTSGEWQNLWVDGVQIEEAAAASRAIGMPPTRVYGWQWVRLRSCTAGSPSADANQGADRALTLLIRGYR